MASKTSRKTTKIHKFTIEEINGITGNFHPDNWCGKGQFAHVFKGVWQFEDVAVKRYNVGHESLATNELEAYSTFGSCPNIVPFKGSCSFNGTIFLVMRYVPKNLMELLKDDEARDKELVKWTDTVSILRQMARGIKSLIDADYVVGDIKPDNVLIDTDDKVYLCDFGSARKCGLGLPTRNEEYCPNEVKGSGKGTSTTDVYSFGVILLQMIMKVNDFPKLNEPLEKAVAKLGKKAGGKKKKKAKNSSKKLDVHVSVKARDKNGNAVNKKLFESGCNLEDAKTITTLGIECTNEHPNQRPSIEHVIGVLEELNV